MTSIEIVYQNPNHDLTGESRMLGPFQTVGLSIDDSEVIARKSEDEDYEVVAFYYEQGLTWVESETQKYCRIFFEAGEFQNV